MPSTAISAQGSTLQIGTATGVAKPITAITLGNPCVITSAAHGLSRGDVVSLAGIVGTTQLNGVTAVVQYVTVNTISLAGIDSSLYTAYASGGTLTPVTWTQINNIKTFSGFDGAASEIDVTNLSSTAKEFRLGLVDPGNFQIDFDNDYADAGQIALRAAQASGVAKQFRLTLPNLNTATFTGFVKKVSNSGGVDQVYKAQAQIRISGAVALA